MDHVDVAKEMVKGTATFLALLFILFCIVNIVNTLLLKMESFHEDEISVIAANDLCCSRICCSRCSRCCCKCCCRSRDVLRLIFGLVTIDATVGDPGRELAGERLVLRLRPLPCNDDRPEWVALGFDVEYEGGGCSSGVTNERQEARRASKD